MSRKSKGKTDSNASGVAPVEKQEQPKVESEVPYQVFFQECLNKGLVKPWQEKEINAFFKDLGLTDKEPSDKYKDALAKY